MAIIKKPIENPIATEPATVTPVEEKTIEDEMSEPLVPATEATAAGTPLGEPPPLATDRTPFKVWIAGWSVDATEDGLTFTKEPNKPADLDSKPYEVFNLGKEGSVNRVMVTVVPMHRPELIPEEDKQEAPMAEVDTSTLTGVEEASVDQGTEEVE